MPSLESLQHHIALTQELQSVVKTMKALAAASILQYERAVDSLADYSKTIELALQAVLPQLNLTRSSVPPPTKIGIVLFGSDQGMCGQFNEQITQYALTEIQKAISSPVEYTWLGIGARVIPGLEAAGQTPTVTLAMPTTLAGITNSVQQLLMQLERLLAVPTSDLAGRLPDFSEPPLSVRKSMGSEKSPKSLDKAVLIYYHYQSNRTWHPCYQQLWPVDQAWLNQLGQRSWPSRTRPLTTLLPQRLFATLIRQHMFISLYRAFAESLASENASRLIAMQTAEQNITNRLGDFNAQFQQERQTLITEEIIEIVAGSAAQAT